MPTYVEKQVNTNNKIDGEVKRVERQAQKNLNSRLDRMRFKNYTKAEFDASAPHAATDISFVTNTDNTISLYKGDTLLSGQGSEIETEIAYAVYAFAGSGLDGTYDGLGIGYIPDLYVHYRTEFQDSPIASSSSTSPRHAIYAYHGFDDENYKQGTFCMFGHKIILDTRFGDGSLSDREDLTHQEATGPADFSTSFPFYRSDGNGGKIMEILYVDRQVDGITGQYRQSGGWDGYSYVGSRYLRSYIPLYKLKIQRIVPSLGITQTTYIHNLPGSWTSHSGNYCPVPCGFIFGCGDVEDIGLSTGSYENMWQIKDPCILWFENSRKNTQTIDGAQVDTYVYSKPIFIKESSAQPMGIQYDIATGNRLEEAKFCFSYPNEQVLGYIMANSKYDRITS
jgi:hypothetical protein